MTNSDKFSIRYEEPYTIFQGYLQEYLDDIAHVAYGNILYTHHELLEYKKIPVANEENLYFYLLKFNKPVNHEQILSLLDTKKSSGSITLDINKNANDDDNQTLPNAIRYNLLLIDTKKTFSIVCERNVSALKIIETIHLYDARLAEELLEGLYEYNTLYGKEVEEYGTEIIDNQNIIQQYLLSNKIIKEYYPIDFDINDDDLKAKWYAYVSEKNANIKEFHYHTPFLMNNAYVVSHSGSAEYYIYKPLNEHSGSWFIVNWDDARAAYKFKSKKDNNDTWEVHYYSNAYIKEAIENHCNQWTLVAEIKDNKIIKATPDLYRVQLTQKFIHEQLIEQELLPASNKTNIKLK